MNKNNSQDVSRLDKYQCRTKNGVRLCAEMIRNIILLMICTFFAVLLFYFNLRQCV